VDSLEFHWRSSGPLKLLGMLLDLAKLCHSQGHVQVTKLMDETMS